MRLTYLLPRSLASNPFVATLGILGSAASLVGLLALIPLPDSGAVAKLAAFLGTPFGAAAAFWASIAALLIFLFMTAVLLRQSHVISAAYDQIPGKRLFEYKNIYPVRYTHRTNLPFLDKAILGKAIRFLLYEEDDRLAAMDLVYLREDNLVNAGDSVLLGDQKLYSKLLLKYDLLDFAKNYGTQRDELLTGLKTIVNDIGATLAGIRLEILLHDVRNPLRSVVALANTNEVSERKLGDPSTRFVVEYVENQGTGLLHGGSKVRYPKQLKQAKRVKATTTPLFDRRFGLFAILCINIDVDAVNALTPRQKSEFFTSYVRAFGETPQFEIDHAPI